METNDVLKNVDTKLTTILDGQKSAADRQKTIEDKQQDLLTKITANDGKLEAQTAALARVEADFNKKRFGNGTGRTVEMDALLSAMPDDLKAWIPRAAGILPGVGLADLGNLGSDIPKRSALAAKIARRSPELYVAVGGVFQARIKASRFARKGESVKAQQWTERAEKLEEALGGIPAASKAALQEDTNAEGGFLIPTITEALIGWLMKEASVVRAAGATIVQMTSKTHQLPTLANDFSVAWIAEEGTITDGAPSTPFGQGALTAKKLASLVTVAIELVQDNIVNLMDFILTHLLQQAGRAEDLQCLEGDGTVFTGLFSASGVNAVAGGSNALSEDELRKLIYGGEHASTLENGVIFAHPFIMRDAIGLAISSGTPWFATVFGVDQQGNARPRNVWGVPAMLTSVISRVRGGGTETTAYHGDPAYIVIGDRMGTSFEVDPYGKFDTAQLRLRLLRRTGVLIWVPAYFTKLTAVTV